MNKPEFKNITQDTEQLRIYAEDLARIYKLEKEKRQKLEEANREITNLLLSINSILIGLTLKMKVTHWNKVAEEVFYINSKDALGKDISSCDINWDWKSVKQGIDRCFKTGTALSLSEILYTDNNNEERILGFSVNPIKDVTGKTTGVLLNGKDITEKKIMERQLQQSGKLAAIGEMATGIAHELNQPLNIIKIAAQIIADSIKNNDYTDDFLNERTLKIIAQVDRADRIISHLRNFGRNDGIVLQPVSINKPILESVSLLGEQLKLHSIDVRLKLSENLPEIMGSPHSLEQVFINLLINSRDALDEMGNRNPEKVISISSYFSKGRKQVCIEFSDNGPGIDEKIINSIFNPFFTTKDVGKGTGLGLSISYGIIKSHNGTIEAAPGKGGGASFLIKLPVKE